MSFFAENESSVEFDFNIDEILKKVADFVLDDENCPYESEVSLLVTNDDIIRQINSETRNIDKVTDVLSFPNCEFETPGDFSLIDESEADYFDPESGELILGDIIICANRVLSQAEEYGHSILREFAFLVAHSMYHLCGYDHMEPEEAKIMEAKQTHCLERLGITRD